MDGECTFEITAPPSMYILEMMTSHIHCASSCQVAVPYFGYRNFLTVGVQELSSYNIEYSYRLPAIIRVPVAPIPLIETQIVVVILLVCLFCCFLSPSFSSNPFIYPHH